MWMDQHGRRGGNYFTTEAQRSQRFSRWGAWCLSAQAALASGGRDLGVDGGLRVALGREKRAAVSFRLVVRGMRAADGPHLRCQVDERATEPLTRFGGLADPTQNVGEIGADTASGFQIGTDLRPATDTPSTNELRPLPIRASSRAFPAGVRRHRPRLCPRAIPARGPIQAEG